jgi:peptide/nickel transport system permease protein
MPGDFTDMITASGATEEEIQAVREAWGLNDPLYIQYFEYIRNLVALDAGESVQYREPIWSLVKIRIINSFILVAPAITVGYIMGSILGTVFKSVFNSKQESYGLLAVISVGAIPEFLLGIILIVIFALNLELLPSSGMIDPAVYSTYADSHWIRPYFTENFALHYILPFTAIALRFTYEPTLIMRTSVADVSGQAFNYYHKISGVNKIDRLKRIGNHAILPVITLFPISMMRAISGVVLVEMVFNWPGIGLMLVEGVVARDYPLVQFVFFLAAVFVIIANFLVDILYGIVDPRVAIGDN